MITLTVEDLVERLEYVLNGRVLFSDLRTWVFDYFYAEEDWALTEEMADVLPILGSYLLYEEAWGDELRTVRIRRLLEILRLRKGFLRERVVFAINFDEIQKWTRKYSFGLITDDVYQRKMSNLHTLPYDAARLIEWADAHKTASDLVPKLLR